jgi:hypothetical protein
MTTNFNDNYLQRKLPKGYMHNLQASYASATTLSLAAGQCRDSTDSVNMELAIGVTINGATNGALGLDTGSLANNTWYYVLALKDSSNTISDTAMLSASSSSYVIPQSNGVTYDAFRVTDYWLTNGSAQFLKGTTVGNGTYRTRYWDTAIAVLTSGTATSLTAIDLSSAVPPATGCVAILSVDYTPATAGDKVSFAPFGSTATVLPHVTGSVAAKANSGIIEVPVALDSGVPKVLYINSAASGDADVWVIGFRYPV